MKAQFQKVDAYMSGRLPKMAHAFCTTVGSATVFCCDFAPDSARQVNVVEKISDTASQLRSVS